MAMSGHWQHEHGEGGRSSGGEDILRLSNNFWGSMKLQEPPELQPNWSSVRFDEGPESYENQSSGPAGHSYGTGTDDSDPNSPENEPAPRPQYNRQTSYDTIASRRADKQRQRRQSQDKISTNDYAKFTKVPEISRRQPRAVIDQPLTSAATTNFTEIDPAPLTGRSERLVDIVKITPPPPSRTSGLTQPKKCARPNIKSRQKSQREGPVCIVAHEPTLKALESRDVRITSPTRRKGSLVTAKASKSGRKTFDPGPPAQLPSQIFNRGGKGDSDGDIDESSVTDFELDNASKADESEGSGIIAVAVPQEVMSSDIAIVVPDDDSCDEGIYETGVTVQIIEEPPAVVPIPEAKRASPVMKSRPLRAPISRPAAPSPTMSAFPQIGDIQAMRVMQDRGRIDVIAESDCESEQEDRRGRSRHPKEIRIMKWLDGLD